MLIFEYDGEFNVRISSSTLVSILASLQDFYQNKVKFWGTTGGIATTTGGIIWFMLFKRKKKRQVA